MSIIKITSTLSILTLSLFSLTSDAGPAHGETYTEQAARLAKEKLVAGLQTEYKTSRPDCGAPSDSSGGYVTVKSATVSGKVATVKVYYVTLDQWVQPKEGYLSFVPYKRAAKAYECRNQ